MKHRIMIWITYIVIQRSQQTSRVTKKRLLEMDIMRNFTKIGVYNFKPYQPIPYLPKR